MLIFSIKNENQGKHTVLDADNLEYISSAGLRVILKIRKEKFWKLLIGIFQGIEWVNSYSWDEKTSSPQSLIGYYLSPRFIPNHPSSFTSL